MEASTPRPSFDPIRIALDLTGPNEPQFRRRNAAKALRIIGTVAAAEALVDVAIGENDDDTRRSITHELIALCSPVSTQPQPFPIPASAVAALFDHCKRAGAEGRRALATVLDLYEAGSLDDSGPLHEALVAVALDEGSPEQRNRAIRLLTTLPPVSFALAARAFRKQLEGPRWQDAYLLLGRLRRHGSPFATPRGIWGSATSIRGRLKSWHQRWLRTWRIAWATSGNELPARQFRWDFLPLATAAAVASAIVGAYDVFRQTPGSLPPGSLSLIVLLGVGVSVVLTIVSTSLSTPILLHYDRGFGTLVALTRASAGPLIVGVLMSVLLTALTTRDWTSAVLLTGSIVSLVVLVKSSAVVWLLLLPHGVAGRSVAPTWSGDNPAFARRARPIDRWMPVFGLQFFSALCIGVTFQWLMRQVFVDSGAFTQELRSMADAIWIILTPAAAGLAATVSLAEWPLESWTLQEAGLVDQEHSRPATHPRFHGRSYAIASGGALALAAVTLTAVTASILREPPSVPVDEWNQAKLGESKLVTKAFGRYDRAEIGFRVAFPQVVSTSTNVEDEDFFIQVLSDPPTGASEDRGPKCERSESPRVISEGPIGRSMFLGWGCYRISFNRDRLSQHPLSALASVFAIRVGESAASLSSLSVELNVDGANMPVTFADGKEQILNNASAVFVVESKMPVDFKLDTFSLVTLMNADEGDVTLLLNQEDQLKIVPLPRSRRLSERQNRTVLRPGRYRLRTTARATWVGLDVRNAVPARVPFEEPVAVPYAVHIAVDGLRRIQASLRDPTTDVVLRLYAAHGGEVAFSDDDPERITQSLPPGDYVILVEENGSMFVNDVFALPKNVVTTTSNESVVLRIQSLSRQQGAKQ